MTEKRNENKNVNVRRPIYEQATSPLEAGRNLSWGAILAGVATAAAVFTTLSLITAALGFGLFSPTSANPLEGIGIGTAISTIIILILSFCAGGFVSGYAARSTGYLHGAITWAVTILLLLTLIFNAIASVLGLAGNVVGSVTKTATNAAGGVASTASDAIGKGLEQASSQIADVDTENLQGDIEKYLKDTDVKELQPEYIQGEIDKSKDEVAQAVKDVALNPENSDQIINDLTTSLKDRAKTIADSADRDAISNAVKNNSDLSDEEADEVTDNIYNGLQDASKQAETSLNEASDEIERLADETQTKVDQTVEDIKEGSEDASNKASIGSVLTFLGLIVALLISAWAGKLGEKKSLQFIRRA